MTIIIRLMNINNQPLRRATMNWYLNLIQVVVSCSELYLLVLSRKVRRRMMYM